MNNRYVWLTIVLFFIVFSCKTIEGDEISNQIDFTKLASTDNPVISPSGKYILIIEEKTDEKLNYYTFKIQKNDNSKKIIFCLNENIFRKRDINYLCWDSSDNIWGYSGDVGAYYWLFDKNGINEQWIKNVYLYGTLVQPPEILVKLRPNFFKKK